MAAIDQRYRSITSVTATPADLQHGPVSLLGHTQLPQHERSVKHQAELMCQASSGTAHAAPRRPARCCDNFLYGFKGALTRATAEPAAGLTREPSRRP